MLFKFYFTIATEDGEMPHEHTVTADNFVLAKTKLHKDVEDSFGEGVKMLHLTFRHIIKKETYEKIKADIQAN